MPVISGLRQWQNGEVFNARDYVYERNLIVSELNRLTNILAGSDSAINLTVNKLTATEIVLNGGSLDDYIRGQAVYTTTQPTDAVSNDLWFEEVQ